MSAAPFRKPLVISIGENETKRMEVHMDVKEAVRTARKYIVDLFADDNIRHVGLEEVRFNDKDHKWEITIGFSRPWDHKVKEGPFFSHAYVGDTREWSQRSFKVVEIDDDTGRVGAVTHRTLAAR